MLKLDKLVPSVPKLGPVDGRPFTPTLELPKPRPQTLASLLLGTGILGCSGAGLGCRLHKMPGLMLGP